MFILMRECKYFSGKKNLWPGIQGDQVSAPTHSQHWGMEEGFNYRPFHPATCNYWFAELPGWALLTQDKAWVVGPRRETKSKKRSGIHSGGNQGGSTFISKNVQARNTCHYWGWREKEKFLRERKNPSHKERKRRCIIVVRDQTLLEKRPLTGGGYVGVEDCRTSTPKSRNARGWNRLLEKRADSRFIFYNAQPCVTLEIPFRQGEIVRPRGK